MHRDFFCILGKLARETPKLGICYSAQLWHFWSIKIQISYYTYYCHNIEGECHYVGSVCVD